MGLPIHNNWKYLKLNAIGLLRNSQLDLFGLQDV